MNSHILMGGSMKFISSRVSVPVSLKQQAEHLAEQGKTLFSCLQTANWPVSSQLPM